MTYCDAQPLGSTLEAACWRHERHKIKRRHFASDGVMIGVMRRMSHMSRRRKRQRHATLPTKPRVLLHIDVICDKHLNTRRRLVKGGGNGGHGPTSLTASFVVVLVVCCVHAELVAFLC